MQSSSTTEALESAVRAVRERVDTVPAVALILGSGLGALAEAAEGAVSISTSTIPDYPSSTVEGHSGRLVFGRMEGHPVVFVQGRAHLYEGHSMGALTFPVRLVAALGARRLLVTNAAGGIHRGLRPGTLMFITDHLNFVGAPMVAATGQGLGNLSPSSSSRPAADSDFRVSASHVAPGPFAAVAQTAASNAAAAAVGPRPPRTYHPYDLDWVDDAEQTALELGVPTRRGVYLWTRGPSYETKAEIAAFRRIGADAVGMSTVPEVLAAAAGGMKVLGISSITNPAAGLSTEPLSHDEVLEVGRQVRGDLERLVRGILRRL